jgi:hypothetical protein
VSSGRARACLCFLSSSTSLPFSISVSVSEQHPPRYGLESTQSIRPQCSRWPFLNSSKLFPFSHSARSVSFRLNLIIFHSPLTFPQPPLAPLDSSRAHKTSSQDFISSPPMTSLSVPSSLKSTTPTPPNSQQRLPFRPCPTRAKARNVTPALQQLHLLPPPEHIMIQTTMRGGMGRKRKTRIDISSRVCQVLNQSRERIPHHSC